MGQEMEAGLWRNLAAFYNANLKNLSGPFDRSYGMDMQNYVSLVGLALGTVLDPDLTPLPSLEASVNHAGDLWLAPQLAILGMEIPADALRSFRAYGKPRLVRQQINSKRIATAWIGQEAMWGTYLAVPCSIIGRSRPQTDDLNKQDSVTSSRGSVMFWCPSFQTRGGNALSTSFVESKL